MRAVLDHVAGRVPVIVAATHFASNICGARSRRAWPARVVEPICREFVASLSMGARQFRTNPGLVFGLEGSDLDRFLGAAATALKALRAPADADTGIHETYRSGPLGTQSGRNRRAVGWARA